MDAVFTTEELAERYQTTAEALRLWRYRRTGPKFFRAGKKVFYREAAVTELEQEQEAAESAKAQ